MTISLPEEIAHEIDRRSPNRSRFILDAVQAYLESLRRDELARSLADPHPDANDLADADLAGWVAAGRDDADLVDPAAGRRVSWRPGRGWTTHNR